MPDGRASRDLSLSAYCTAGTLVWLVPRVGLMADGEEPEVLLIQAHPYSLVLYIQCLVLILRIRTHLSYSSASVALAPPHGTGVPPRANAIPRYSTHYPVPRYCMVRDAASSMYCVSRGLCVIIVGIISGYFFLLFNSSLLQSFFQLSLSPFLAPPLLDCPFAAAESPPARRVLQA